MLKRSISIILCLAMLLTMLPVNALATEEIIPTEAVEAAVETEAEEEVEAEESAEQTEGAEETQDTEAAEPETIYEDGDEDLITESACADCGVIASPYLQQLPENILGCTNLYDCLAPVKGYYTATKYDTSNGAVLSVVIPVEPGDRIAASSFASVSENMGSVNGIRVTYLLGDEIVISLSPGEVYSGYTKDGYITVPDGVDTVCVPWWKPSDSNWLTLSQISRDFAVHSPRTVPEQAPTCTEIGYTAGEICEICNAFLGEREEIPPTGHTYSGDTCTVCGTINLLTILDGKYVSILGDSISTFNGYSNDATVNTTIGGNGPRYDAGTADTKPGSYCLLETVDHTWWMHFAGRSGMKLLVNNSWAGSQVFGGKTSDGRVIPAAYLDRCVNLHDNTLENNPTNAPINPDVIFVYLGINDYNFNRSKVGNGAVDYAGLVNSDGTYASPETFGEAYGIMLHKMQKAYPDAEIFAMTLLPENLYSVDKAAWEQYNAYIRAAAEYYDIPVVDLAENCAITWENYSGCMIDRIHPTTAGMELISDCIEAELVSYYGENPQHTHSYESAVTVPTCTGKGYTTYTCTCGDSYVAEYVDATGHKRINGICSFCGDSFAGKKASILSHSMSTYAGVSNSTASNSTIGKNDVYYTEGRHDVYREDTWWQQTIDALGMELLVNNSWSGSCVFMPRKGEASVGYGDRAVNLHNDHTGEEPDAIFVYLGCNDFAYYKDTFGKAADVDYATLIRADGTYGIPQTTCEAYAIMLHKAATRYPDAEIYCITSTARRETDYTGDSYPDAGQPTLYTAELQKVAQYFGYPVVDLENAIPKEVEIFDKYIGDKRAHANKLGMDQITNEVLSVMLGKDAEIRHVICGDGTVQEQAVLLGGSYQAEITLAQGYSVVVTMGGKDVTAEVCQNDRIAIAEVTGDIHVETIFERDPQSFRWEFRDGTLTSAGSSENVVTKLSGTVADNILNDCIFEMNTPVVLKHDLPWAVEWKCAEDWRGAMLVSQKESATKGMTYLTRTKGGQLCFGTYTGSQYNNYGIDISDLNSETHSYRLENRIAEDGSNMIWLYLDGIELGPMNSYFIGSKDQSKTSNWVSGKDFAFSFIGMTGHALRNCQLDYLSVTECDHTYENGICTGCGEEASFEFMTMQYDDHVDISGRTLEIVDAGSPTSWQVGYDVEENTVADAAVVTVEGDHLVATGIGTARVRMDGILYEITVEAAPISLLLLIGQSNMQGSEGNADQSIVCPDGMVYSTYGDRYTMTISNATNFAPSALTGAGSAVNVNGTTTNLEDWPVYLLNEAGAGKAGPDSGYAYEWVRQTGEKVWIVNAAHGGTSIKEWQNGGTQYKECISLFKACQETLCKEIAAGHFTLSHTGYFWCQGCTDETQTAEWYVNKYLSMHESLKKDLTTDLNGDGTPDELEFSNMTVTLAGHVNKTGYRYEDGLYDAADNKFFMTYEELEMRGQRVAQYWLAANPDYPEINMVCNIGESWVTMPDGTNGVKDYFQSSYENGTVDYRTQVKQAQSWYTPTTPKAVKDSIHYNQIGYNEVGIQAARNTLILLGEIDDTGKETTVKFVDWTGYREAASVAASDKANSGTLVVPIIYPCYRSKQVSYELSDGLMYEYYDLLASSDQMTGTLTAVGAAGSVDVKWDHIWSGWVTVADPSADGPGVEERICTDCGEVQKREINGVWQTLKLSEHMTEMPEDYCSGTNLWTAMEHDKYFFNGTSSWNVHASGTVYSVTIPVRAGDRIFATSFGAYPANGGSKSGIRCTFFDAEGVAKTYAPADTYKAFVANGGYLVAPEGAVAVNIPMWNNSNENELYILNREHCYGRWSVTSCPTPQKSGEAVRICKGCGSSDSCELEYAENRIYLEEKTDIVWIDGAEYAVQNGEVCYVDLPDGNAKTMVIHTYGEKDGKEYPVGMKVWTLENNDGFYTATRQEEFDDILQYAGSSIRVTGKKGIRMITAIDQEKKKDLITDGLAGYTLKEYGTVIAWASQIDADKPLVLGKSYVKSNYAYKQGVADPIFASKDGKMQYTNVLVNFSDEQCKKDIAMRPYMILEDFWGNEITLYGGIVERSIGYIAAQNAYTFDSEKPEEKDAHDYIWNIILYVYGEDFVPEKA